MATFRLIQISTGEVSSHLLDQAPRYLAASHAWSEQRFPLAGNFLSSPGRQALLAVNQQRYEGTLVYCWVDTICIDQQNDEDMNQQIPLMGRIFGNAVAVAILLSCDLQMSQAEVDRVVEQLEPAVEMHVEEAWKKEGAFWQSGPGRPLIVQGMRGLARLTTTHWCARVWTLQEYILASNVIWVGTDLVSLVIKDVLLSALPDICDTLNIEECLGDDFANMYAYFSGMANLRLKRCDRTRVMELLGNRSADLPRDEVYGIMAASGVEIPVSSAETKLGAWSKWFETAVAQGHVRWLLTPVTTPAPKTHRGMPSCILPAFTVRHSLSSSSALDTVKALGHCRMDDGTVVVDARWVGTCEVKERLGEVHEPAPNRIHRDITLILFGQGKFTRASKVARAFGAGRYSPRQLIAITRTLRRNHERAVLAVRNHRESQFELRRMSKRENDIWGDFMEFQMGQMPGMNNGTAYLVNLRRDGVLVEAIIVLPSTETVPKFDLGVIDLGGRTVDNRCIFMVVAEARPRSDVDGPFLHKVAVTLPVSGDYEDQISSLPLQELSIGGETCAVCRG